MGDTLIASQCGNTALFDKISSYTEKIQVCSLQH